MDLKTLDDIKAMQAQGLAHAWDFSSKTGYRLIPKTAEQTAQLLSWTGEHQRQIAMNPLDAGMLAEPLWLDLSELKQVRQYPVDDFIIQVETGITVGELSRLLAKNWQAFPLSYPAETMLSDILAEDRPSLETGFRGYPRDYVLKAEIATPDGQITITGADVVKNVTGYDLAKLYVGGRHAFGVLTSVTLKLTTLPQNKRYWLYHAESLYAAFALSDKLLASNLPISMCELFQEGSEWQILIEIAGDDWVLVEYVEVLNQLSAQTPQMLDTETGIALAERLQRWPEESTILEAAFPIANWSELASGLLKQSALGDMRFQIRPAAGLVMISAPFFPYTALPYLKAEIQQHTGFAQMLRIAKTDVATFAEATAVYEMFNLPEEPAVRGLLKSLKKSYDPDGMLFTPRLPL